MMQEQMLIDTNILSYYLFGDYPNVIQNFEHYVQEYEFVYIGRPTVFEVLSGLKAKKATQKLIQFELFMKQHQVLEITEKSTIISSNIYADLRRKGIIIGENDLYLAGIALEKDLTFCTNNTKHFEKIIGLKLVNWI